MKSATRRCAFGAALTLTAAGLALACGFDFPQTLLDHRQDTLLGLRPTDWMSMQIGDLLPQVTDTLKANEGTNVTAADIERSEVDATHAAQLATMRAAKDGAAAYAAGDGLPEAVRLYAAGAVEFQHAATAARAKEDASAQLAAALSYFQNVLRLPDEQRAPRAMWASYMAGRVQRLAAGPAAPDRAIAYFQQTRDLARKGLPDPLGLAVASYGEEARIALEQGDVPHAAELYLEQAARGSAMARSSLGDIGERLAADPDLALQHIQDQRLQKLWFATVLAEGPHGYYLQRPGDGADLPNSWAARVIKVTAGMDRTKASRLDGLAAIAYTTGSFDLAASLAAGVNTPLAAVVRAKLALRAGDRGTAAKEFAAAISHRSGDKATEAAGLSDRGWSRLLAENGVLAMSRGDYADALQSLLEAGSEHWLDAAYVAERVLTLDELTGFANRHVPARTARDQRISTDPYWHDYFGTPPDTSRALRLLLARRQMREQQFDAALENFRNNDFAVDEKHPSLAAIAGEYVAAIRDSTKSWTRIKRAAALFKAAQLSKLYGMELLGYELAPDFSTFGGETTMNLKAEAGSYSGVDENSRVNANPPPEVRFHYRAVAFDLANRSADNLPPRSQAFAAVLCASLRWAQSGDDMDQARSQYRRYVREAAYVPWSPKFGARCEAPDFRRASAFLWQTRIHSARVALRPYKFPLVVLAMAAVVGGVFALRRRRIRARLNVAP